MDKDEGMTVTVIVGVTTIVVVVYEQLALGPSTPLLPNDTYPVMEAEPRTTLSLVAISCPSCKVDSSVADEEGDDKDKGAREISRITFREGITSDDATEGVSGEAVVYEEEPADSSTEVEASGAPEAETPLPYSVYTFVFSSDQDLVVVETATVVEGLALK